MKETYMNDEKNKESILDKLSENEKKDVGMQLLGKSFLQLISSSPRGNAGEVLSELRPQLLDIDAYLDEDGPGSRESFLEELRKKCDNLPDLGVDFDDYVYDLCEADWTGYENPTERVQHIRDRAKASARYMNL